ncbi:MAG: Heat shock protein Hsp20 [Parcubacteria group bacterium GW2011_GWA2_47_26]|nr:MAG: Heat shock protein Hsp20 [Parcubacteria group bacterium GW2011_GWA2_47_26]
MPIIHWRPFHPHFDPFEDMEHFFREDWPSFLPEKISGFMPAVDVYEKGNDVIIETPLAGVDPKDVEVSFKSGMVVIKGETKRKSEVDEKNFYRQEMRYGSFYRQVALPAAVQEEKAEATSENGVLKVVVPKAADAPKAKVVKVKVKK